MKYSIVFFICFLFISACKKPYLTSFAGNYYNNCLEKKPLAGRNLSLTSRNPPRSRGEIATIITDSNGQFFFRFEAEDQPASYSIEDETTGTKLFSSEDQNAYDITQLTLYEKPFQARLNLQFKSDKVFTEKDTLFYYNSLFIDDTGRYRFVVEPTNNMIIDSSYYGFINNEIGYVWGIGKTDFDKSWETFGTRKKEKYYQCDRVKLNDVCTEKEYLIFEK